MGCKWQDVGLERGTDFRTVSLISQRSKPHTQTPWGTDSGPGSSSARTSVSELSPADVRARLAPEGPFPPPSRRVQWGAPPPPHRQTGAGHRAGRQAARSHAAGERRGRARVRARGRGQGQGAVWNPLPAVKFFQPLL